MDALESIRVMYGETDTDEQINPSKRFKSSESMKLGHHESTASSPPPKEFSQPSQVDCVGPPPPMGSVESMIEMCEKIDPQEINTPQRLKPSESMNSSHHRSTPSSPPTMETSQRSPVNSMGPPPPMDAIESSRGMYQNLDPVKQIDPFHKMNEPSEAGPSSSEGWLETLPGGLAAKAKDTISKEKPLSISDAMEMVRHCSAADQFEKTSDIWDSRGLSSTQIKQILDAQWSKDYGGDKDVFLSHSGKQKNFVRHLHRELTREQVSCFFDEDEKSLPLAQRFPSLIFKHAETCKIAVLVLSKDFICSKWPMLELSAFIRAMKNNDKLRLFPVFFMIKSKELKITKDSPEWPKWDVSDDIKGEWQAALNIVRSNNGLRFSEGENEVALIDNVVKQICGILERINPKSHLLDFEPVGMEEAREEVTRLLGMKELSHRVVIIYGVGGIGKTTLATLVFNSLDLSGYDNCRVDMNQDPSQRDLKNMQKKILHYAFHKENSKFYDCKEGLEELSKAFEKSSDSKPVFLFIDNVLREEDLEKLLPIERLSLLPKQSRILLTTRDLKETEILKIRAGIKVYSYRVDSVSEPQAERLLCHYVLGGRNGSFARGVNMHGLLRFCGGIPLVLRIVGCHLLSNGLPACDELLTSLKRWEKAGYEGGKEDLSERIVDFVYKRLREPSKEAFLDIVFFFHDRERSEVADIVGEMELRELEGAALVTTSQETESYRADNYVKTKVKVKIHDIVRARGEKLSGGSRIIDRESLGDLLLDEQKLQQIKGIWIEDEDEFIDELFEEAEFTSLEAQYLDLMSRSLRVLRLGEYMRLHGKCKRDFKDLRFLSINHEDILPINLTKSKQLVYFQGCFRLIHINHPDVLRRDQTQSRQLVNFRGCLMEKDKISVEKFTIHLPESLRLLYLDACSTSVPPGSLDIRGHFPSLRELELSNFSLENLETATGKFPCLKILKLNYITSVHESFGNLPSLQILNMDSCMLERLPESFGNLCSLEMLDIKHSALKTLPQSFGNLSSLQTLSLYCCSSLCSLPDNFGHLKCLKYLDISGCKELKRLPDDMVWLASLVGMKSYGCDKLEAKAMDILVQISSLLFLEIGQSPMLIKRWEEIQQDRPLLGAIPSFYNGMPDYTDVMSPMFFNGAGRFLHVDGAGQLAEVASWSFAEVGVKVAVLLTVCHLSNEEREKLVEVASQGIEIIYVDVGVEGEAEEQRKKRIRETLLQLPERSRAWTSCFRKNTLLFAYSLWRLTGRADTSIVCTLMPLAYLALDGRRNPNLWDKDIPKWMFPIVDDWTWTTLLSPLDEAWNYPSQLYSDFERHKLSLEWERW